MYQVSEQHFEDMVEAALDAIPQVFVDHMRNLVILVEDYHEDSPDLLGLYEGVALPERSTDDTGFLPDTIFIYRQALMDWCSSEEELAYQVKVTLFHELGHYFGLSEEQLHALGWG